MGVLFGNELKRWGRIQYFAFKFLFSLFFFGRQGEEGLKASEALRFEFSSG